MTKYLYLLIGLGLLVLTGCGITMQDVVRGIEPIVDAGVKLAADSAGASAQKAIEEQTGALGKQIAEQWTGGEITAMISSIIMGAYATSKGALFIKNNKAAPRT